MRIDHPAVTELKKEFILHDDRTRQKIETWVERWISVNLIETTMSADEMTAVDQDVLFDQMFTRLAKSAVVKKTVAAANKLPNGDFHFVMTVHCLNKEPNRILRALS